MKKSFIIKAQIWKWPSNMGWFFVTLEKNLSNQIRSVYVRGFVPIIASVGKTNWNTSLFPHITNKKVSKQVEYLICINKKVMKAENLFIGDIIKIKIVLK